MSKSSASSARPTPGEIYQTLAESLPVAVILTTADGTRLYVNEKAVRISGYSMEELMSGAWTMFLDASPAKSLYERALRERAPGSIDEIQMLRKDGRIIWAWVKWQPIASELGDDAGMCTVIADITQRKNAEEALRAANERFSALTENATDILLEWSLDGKVTFASDSVSQLGYEPADWIGKSVLDFVAPEAKERIRAIGAQQLIDLMPSRHEVTLLTKDGAVVELETQVDVVLQNGVPVRKHAVARDITQRRQAEEALRESELKYKSIVENSSDLIVLTTPQGKIDYASPASRVINGYEADELITTNPWVIHPEDTERMRAVFMRARQGESRTGVEYRIVTKSGETRWVSHSWSPIYVRGHVQTVVSVIRDITDHKQSQQALEKAHTELEQAYKIQREFLNNVTHEVRTPLTAVKGYAEMLMEGMAGPITEEQAGLLMKVLESSQHLLDVLNGILQIARLKSGQVALNPKVCDPRAVIDKCVSVVLPQAHRKGLYISVRSGTSGCLGMYDEDKLVIIITNLLSNAVKFTETGAIDVTVESRGSGAEIVIADTGMGIPESELPSIYDEFRQLDYPRKHKPTGFGIGLAIVATMVDTIGGSLTVSSKQGVGTAFTFRVPVVDE